MDEFKKGQVVIALLTEKHSLETDPSDLVKHKAKFLGYHLDRQWADVELEKEHDGGTTRLSLPVSVLKALVVLFALFSAAWPSHAQEIYTSPQTVDANLATNLACTGAAQTFVTGTTA